MLYRAFFSLTLLIAFGAAIVIGSGPSAPQAGAIPRATNTNVPTSAPLPTGRAVTPEPYPAPIDADALTVRIAQLEANAAPLAFDAFGAPGLPPGRWYLWVRAAPGTLATSFSSAVRPAYSSPGVACALDATGTGLTCLIAADAARPALAFVLLGSVLGSVLGAVFMTLVPELLKLLVSALPAATALNVNTASALVLSTLADNLSPQAAQQLVQARGALRGDAHEQLAEPGIGLARQSIVIDLRVGAPGVLHHVLHFGLLLHDRRHFAHGFPQCERVLRHGDCVQVDDAIESVVTILKFNPLLNRTKVIAEVEGIAGGLNSREDALLAHGCILARLTVNERLISALRACLPSIAL